MIPELITLGDALVSLGYETGWVTRGDDIIEWIDEPANSPTLATVQAELERLRNQ